MEVFHACTGDSLMRLASPHAADGHFENMRWIREDGLGNDSDDDLDGGWDINDIDQPGGSPSTMPAQMVTQHT